MLNSLKPWPDWTQFCMRSAVRLVARLPKFSSITAYKRVLLHWLPIGLPQRIKYFISDCMVSRCVLHCILYYLCDLCCPATVLAARRVLRSAARGELLVPWARLAIMRFLSISMEGSPRWTAFHADDFKILHRSAWSPSLAMTGLGAPLSSSLLKRRYIRLQNECTNKRAIIHLKMIIMKTSWLNVAVASFDLIGLLKPVFLI